MRPMFGDLNMRGMKIDDHMFKCHEDARWYFNNLDRICLPYRDQVFSPKGVAIQASTMRRMMRKDGQGKDRLSPKAPMVLL